MPENNKRSFEQVIKSSLLVMTFQVNMFTKNGSRLIFSKTWIVILLLKVDIKEIRYQNNISQPNLIAHLNLIFEDASHTYVLSNVIRQFHTLF